MKPLRIAPLALLVALVPIANAVAQSDGGAPVPSPATSATIAPHTEGEGEEPDHGGATPPQPKPGSFVRKDLVQKDGMVRIPGGRFTMGSSEKTSPANERPARVVTVTSFWMDKTEVSVGAYRACVERNACAKPLKSSTQCTFDAGDPLLPMSCVPWSAAQTYCLAVGRRLPREAEWEYAARGPLAIRYPWGGAAGNCGAAATLAHEGTARTCSGKRPYHVGAHPSGASPFGILDMSGNVEEWVADWYSESLPEASPRAGASHVLRGGGWLSVPSGARTTSRNWGSVLEAGPNVGFRCAKDDFSPSSN